MHRLFVIVAPCLACSGAPAPETRCAEPPAGTSEKTPEAGARAEPSAVVEPESGEAERPPAPAMKDITAVNEWLAAQGATPLPVLVALAYARFEAKQVSYRVDYQGREAPQAARVTVTLDGLLDDSVRGEEHVLEFRREADGTWRLQAIVARVRCWPGRGSETFSDKPCV